jgi:hypothetical protein
MSQGSSDRAMTLVCRIDDILGGENMADVRDALRILVALYLFDRPERDAADFFLDVLSRCDEYTAVAKVETPADRAEALIEINRRLSGH